MLTHSQIWAAIDALAERFDMSPSALARKAGLDPTSFNKSKRITADGRERWPSTESLSRILQATDSSLEDFIRLISNNSTKKSDFPGRLLSGREGKYYGLSGFQEEQSKSITLSLSPLPVSGDPEAFLYTVEEGAAESVYDAGARLVISPGSELTEGSRVFVRLKDNTILLGELNRLTTRETEITTFGRRKAKRVLKSSDVALTARILWASQ